MKLFDTHAHLNDSQFDEIRDDVVRRAREAGVQRINAVGTTVESSEKCIAISKQHPGLIRSSVGIHPNCCAETVDGDWDRIVELSALPEVVAVGETGLDRHWDYAPFDLQQDYFDRHLRLSQQTDLPFIVHMRDCMEDILVMLRAARERGPLRGVMHSFTGDNEAAGECLSLGLYISFAGMVTFKKSDDLRDVAASIPADKILIETDAPYLSPHPKRGQRPNEPALVALTAQSIAAVRGVDEEEFAAQTYANGMRLFNRDE